MKVSIIGAGHVGGQIADRLVFQKLSDNVVILDIDKDLAKAKAEDISHAACIYKLDAKIIGTDDFSLCKESDIIVITAGSARKSGMTRDDLAYNNKNVIKKIIKNIVKYDINSIIIVVTNPVDIMTYFAYKYSGFDRFKIIGMAGVLDSGRLSYIVSKQRANLPSSLMESMVIGEHGKSMICLPKYIKFKAKNINDIMPEENIEKVFNDTAATGARLVSLYKGNSAFFGPSAGVSKIIELIKSETSQVIPCSVVLKGEYKVDDVCLGVPVVLSNKGIEKIIELDLSLEEKNKFLNIAQDYKEKIKNLKGD